MPVLVTLNPTVPWTLQEQVAQSDPLSSVAATSLICLLGGESVKRARANALFPRRTNQRQNNSLKAKKGINPRQNN